jgi:hypothetical protein
MAKIRKLLLSFGLLSLLALLGGCAGGWGAWAQKEAVDESPAAHLGDERKAGQGSQKAASLPAWMRTNLMAEHANTKLADIAESNWEHKTFPTKRTTRYQASQMQGREALHAQAERSMSVMRKRVKVQPQDLGQIQFSWLAKQAIAQANMALREHDDGILRVVLTFEGDRGLFSAKNQMLSDLALSLTGEELPYATLMYVWSNKHAVGEVIVSPRTDRIRKLVVESGTVRKGQWLDYERDIRADFLRAFGESPGALSSISFMTDTDNTQSTAAAWYGPLSLRASQPHK